MRGILPDDSGINPRVVKMELYEINPPPGNSGGAVSGAEPWAFAAGAQSDKKNATNAKNGAWGLLASLIIDFFQSKQTVPGTRPRKRRVGRVEN